MSTRKVRRRKRRNRLFRLLRAGYYVLRAFVRGTVGLFVRGFHAAIFGLLRFRKGWHTRKALASLPALAAAAMMAGFAVAASRTSKAELCVRYVQAGDRARATRDFAAGQTCYRKAIALGEQRPEILYNLAMCLDGLQRSAAAEAVLVRLTGDGPGGFAPAHLLRAQRLVAKANRTPAAVNEAIVQLQRALARQADLTDARFMLGDLYWSSGRLDDAEAVLKDAAKANPGVNILLAQLSLAKNDGAEAKIRAGKARDYFRPLANEGDAAAVVACAQAYLCLGEYENSISMFKEGLARREHPVMRQSLGASYAAWAKSVEKADSANTALRWKIIEHGLRYAPNELGLLRPLYEMSNLTGNEAERARTMLEKLLTEEKPSAVLHVLLGLDAWQRGKQEAARTHLELANQLMPDVAVVSNNLAWMMTMGPKPDLPRALALADAAVKRWPEQPNFRDTRGQILVKLERYREALVDLEIAQRNMSGNSGLHAALATAYEKLGMAAIAERHRRQAEPKPAP